MPSTQECACQGIWTAAASALPLTLTSDGIPASVEGLTGHPVLATRGAVTFPAALWLPTVPAA